MIQLSEERIHLLLRKYMVGEATADELAELSEVLNSGEHDQVILGFLEQEAGQPEQPFPYSVERLEELFGLMSIRMKEAPSNGRIVKGVFTGNNNWKKWTAAAAVIIVLLGGFWLYRGRQGSRDVVADAGRQHFKNDITPAQQGIILTMGDGSVKSLDTVANGMVATEGRTKVMKASEGLSYQQSGGSSVVYNTVATQKGRTYHLQLPDGTNVWLDAVSSIHFPTAFSGAQRVVEITGQAYFEVVHNPAKPFIVSVNNMQVEVLGTHFNISAYSDEALAKTTLLEGKVRVTKNGGIAILKPGEQAMAGTDSPPTVEHAPDIDEVMAWKNGRFTFSGRSVDEIMNQVARWYDIQVIYRDKINESFVADIRRGLPLSTLLSLLELTKQVKFQVDGNKITVMKA